MKNMKTISSLQNLVLVALVLGVATAAQAFSIWPFDLPSPEIYIIKGHLDRAPDETKVLDEIEILAEGKRRTLLVTWYGTPGETNLDQHLSRIMARPFTIRGDKEQIRHLADAPPGTEIDGKFVAYTHGMPWLMIAELDFPTADGKAEVKAGT